MTPAADSATTPGASSATTPGASSATTPETSGAAALEVAAHIAREIADAAVWKDERCNWIGAMPEEGQEGRTTLSFRALGADLYGGSAGVGLFLAETAAATGDEQLRRAALGALRHAVSRTEDIPEGSQAGLYSGCPGVALALALSAVALEEPELTGAACAIADATPAPQPAGELDLMSGSAGAVVGLLTLRTMLGDERLLDAAILHGEALLQTGRAQRGGDVLALQSDARRTRG